MPGRSKKTDFEPTAFETIKRYGSYIDLGACMVTRNLNLLTLRGSARIDMLALISSPDKFDMRDNTSGTQRELDVQHADACYNYAAEAIDIPPLEQARAFPEIMLNVREMSSVEFYNLEDPGELYEISSDMSDTEIPSVLIGFRVSLERLQLPAPDKNPQISRFDGNHRLSGMDRHLEEFFQTEEPATTFELPQIPYSLFVDLATMEEKRLFNVINHEHKGMEPALLDFQTFDLEDEEKLRTKPKLLPLWLSRKLSEDGRAFAGMVFFGGSTRGLKSAGIKLPLRINTVRAVTTIMIASGGSGN